MSLNLRAYIGAIREWVGKGADRHEACNVTVAHPTLIVGAGHIAALRIDVARALVALGEETSADKVLIALNEAISFAERERERIKADGTGRKRGADAAPSKEWVSPLLKRDTPAPAARPVARKVKAQVIVSNALAAPAKPQA